MYVLRKVASSIDQKESGKKTTMTRELVLIINYSTGIVKVGKSNGNKEIPYFYHYNGESLREDERAVIIPEAHHFIKSGEFVEVDWR